MKMLLSVPIIQLWLAILQVPPPIDMGPLQSLLDTVSEALRFLYVFITRWYFIFVVLGFIVYATTLYDSTAKVMVSFGIIAFFIGPFMAGLIAGMPLGSTVVADGNVMMMDVFGMTDGDLMFLLLSFADLVAATCILIGAIMHFTQPSHDMIERGKSLMTRGIILLFVCVIMYAQPFL